MSAAAKALGSLGIALIGLVVYLGAFILGVAGIKIAMIVLLYVALALTVLWTTVILVLSAGGSIVEE
ncbi:MAG: hypothetical protein HQL38_11350 [Alphaproteobacteria bacterium]|nr:hypothetical protein [Alphaproteobacteria bacterium]MBF0372821.1 hypothetical protein [Alphaproteobacteria bacterium]MBF0393265.1 hypothetical protein [Alphaproteobacteria bacterium]